MRPEDFTEFKEVMNRDCNRRSKPVHDGGVLDEFFEDLEDITIEQFVYAAKCHRRSDAGMFALSVANIRKQLGLVNVQDLQWFDVPVMAKAKNTPLAIVASRYIKSHELKFNTPLENKYACDLFLNDLAGHVFRLEEGEFTDHELILCKKYKVNPSKSIHTGHGVLPCPDRLLERYNEAQNSEQWRIEFMPEKEKMAIADNREGQLKVARAMAEIGSSLQTVKEPINYTGAEAAQILEDDLK